jgi:tetratricopeptide (TPR) repeat protein
VSSRKSSDDKRRSSTRSPPLRERAAATRARDRHVPRRSSRTSRPTRRALAALDASTASSVGALRRRAPRGSSSRPRAGARRPQVPPRLRRSRSTSATPPARSRTTARSCSSIRPTTPRARARESARNESCAPRPPRSSRRSTRSARLGEARRRSRSSPRREADGAQRGSAAAQGRAHRRREPRGPDRAFDALARALKRATPPTRDARELEQLAATSGVGRSTASLRRSPEPRSRTRARARLLDAAREGVRRAARQGRRGRQPTARCSRIDAADGEALAALDALYRAPSVGPTSSACTVVASSWPRRPGARARSTRRWPRSTRRSSAARGGDRLLPRGALSRRGERGGAHALDALFTRQKMWERARRQPRGAAACSPRTKSSRSRSCCDSRRCARREMAQIETAIDIYPPGARARPGNAEALAALERLGKRRARARPSPRSWSRSTASRATSRSSSACTRCRSGAATTPLAGRAAPPDRPALRGRRRRLDSAFDTMARALAEDPTRRRSRASIASPAPPIASPISRRSSSSRPREQTIRRCERALTMSARVYENDSARWTAPIGTTARCSRSIRRTSTRPSRSSASSGRRSATPSSRRCSSRRPTSSTTPRRRPRSSRRRASRKTCSSARRGHRRLQQDPRARPDDLPRDRRAHQALPGAVAVERPARRLRKKADLVVDPDEKKRIYYQVGRGLRARAQRRAPRDRHLPARARARPDDLQALSRLDVLYQTAQNWPELLSVLSSEAELRTIPAESVSYQYRIAELYEKHLDDVARAIELYRDCSQQMPDHEPTLAALEGIKDGPRRPLAAALVLEPIYDATGEWQRLVSVLEVQVGRGRRVPARRPAAPHRAPLRGDARRPRTRRSTRSPAPLACDVANEDSLGNLERLASAIGVGPTWPPSTTPARQASARDPERFVELGLRLAQIFEVQLEDVDNAVARYRRVLEIEAENGRDRLPRPPLRRRPERWKSSRTCSPARPRSPSTADEILEFKYRSGRSPAPAQRPARRDRVVPRGDPAAAPEHAATLEALEGLFAPA